MKTAKRIDRIKAAAGLKRIDRVKAGAGFKRTDRVKAAPSFERTDRVKAAAGLKRIDRVKAAAGCECINRAQDAADPSHNDRFWVTATDRAWAVLSDGATATEANVSLLSLGNMAHGGPAARPRRLPPSASHPIHALFHSITTRAHEGKI